MRHLKHLLVGGVLSAVAAAGAGLAVAAEKAVFCKYCGRQAASVRSLTANKCSRHPSGAFKGSHVLYEGSEKPEYVCKFCGFKAKSIQTLTANKCSRHPSGRHKGPHVPAL